MQEDIKNLSTAKMREKSTPYPSYNLEDCLEFTRRIDELGGKGVSEASLLGALGLKSARTRSFSGRLSSSKQFGLVQGSASNLQLTEASQLILRPIDGETQRRQLLSEAFHTPKLYNQLIARFSGKKIPETSVLGNILMHDYRIAKAVREQAAKVFVESAKYAGLLSDDGVLIERTAPEHTEDQQGQKYSPPLGRGEAHSLQVALSGGRMASIALPSDATKNDIERLKKMLDVLAPE